MPLELSQLFSGQRYNEGEEVVPIDTANTDQWVNTALRIAIGRMAMDEILTEDTALLPELRFVPSINLPTDFQPRFRVVSDVGDEVRLRIENATSPDSALPKLEIRVPKN